MGARHLIGIAQMRTSDDAADVLVAPNLGSCLGVVAYDPKLKRGGMIHCLLPLSSADPEKARSTPTMYVDTGVALLLETLLKQGSQKKDLLIAVGGGSNINDTQNVFEIGKRNYTVLRKILWKNNLLIKGEHCGASYSRTVSLAIGTGTCIVKTPEAEIQLL
jgi:chemotaxis protein CheD